MNNVVTNKIQSIQRCISQARTFYSESQTDFETNFLHQDAAILNLIRACESTIDLANYVIRKYLLGIPTSSAESFELLEKAGVIDTDLANLLKKMVGFRNTLVHQYTKIDIAIVIAVVTVDSNSLIEFGDEILRFTNGAA